MEILAAEDPNGPLIGYLVTAIGVLGGVVAVLFWLLIKGRDTEVKRVVDLTVSLNSVCETLETVAKTVDRLAANLGNLDARLSPLERVKDATDELVARFEALLARLDGRNDDRFDRRKDT